MDVIASLYCLTVTNDGKTTDEPSLLTPILDSFADVFEKSHGLPPVRLQNYAIHLIPGAGPVNVKPYCYPYFQK